MAKTLEKALTDRFTMTAMGESSLVLGMIVTHDYDKGGGCRNRAFTRTCSATYS